MPTINELYRPFVVFPVTTNANAALKNEELRGVDVGIDLAPTPAIDLSVTAFYNKVENAIANVTLDATTRQRQNVNAIRAQGLEFGASLHFGTVSFDGSLALTDAEVQASGTQVQLDGKRPEIVLEAIFPDGATGTDLFAEAPEDIFVPVPKPVGLPEAGKQRYAIGFGSAAEADALKGKTLRLTLVSDGGAREASYTVE